MSHSAQLKQRQSDLIPGPIICELYNVKGRLALRRCSWKTSSVLPYSPWCAKVGRTLPIRVIRPPAFTVSQRVMGGTICAGSINRLSVRGLTAALLWRVSEILIDQKSWCYHINHTIALLSLLCMLSCSLPLVGYSIVVDRAKIIFQLPRILRCTLVPDSHETPYLSWCTIMLQGMQQILNHVVS